MKNFDISSIIISKLRDVYSLKLKKHTSAKSKTDSSALIIRQSGVSVYTVGGKEYTLVSSESPEYMNRVAAYVDRKLEEMAMATRLPTNMVAVLTALNMADELMKAHDENSRLRREIMALRAGK